MKEFQQKQFWCWVLNILILITTSSVDSVNVLCGYPSCPKSKPGYINVHLVAHSHDDVGWLKTVDQYYHGTNREVDPGAVQYILDSVVAELKKNPNRKFIYVESAFFWRWWKSQDEETKNLVTKLVRNGQLEFISGGWSMNDEGSTHYNALIDQMSLGMRFLNDTFGECAVPKIAWQIDTFGHSREQAFIFSQLGFDAFFIGRMDYQYKSHRMSNHEMEMIWSSNPNNIGKAAWIFTGILYNYYQPPNGFCFDQLCKDDPINDDPKLDDYNVEQKVKRFIRLAQWWASPYNTNHTLMTMGSDFHYMNANMWFKNLDKLIKYVNAFDYGNDTSTKVNVMYSSPSCYLQEVHKSGKRLPIKTSDFFPYSNDPYGFWSGYFTSRPTFKYFIHKANNFLQACKQLAVGAFQGKPETRILEKVFELSEPVAIVQHHDAITGTAKQYVTDDYSRRLAIGMKNCEEVVDEAFRKLQQVPTYDSPSGSSTAASASFSTLPYTENYQFCQLMNISACAATENMTDFLVSIYNPLAKNLRNIYVRIPVSSPYWQVQGQSGSLPFQIVEIPEAVLKIPGRNSTAKYEIVFKLDQLPGLALENVRITSKHSKDNSHSHELKQENSQTTSDKSMDIVLENSKGVKLVLDSVTGLLKSISRGKVQLPLQQNFYYYLGMAGNNTVFKWRASGAYVLRPNTSAADGHKPIKVGDRVESYKIHKGTHVTEVHQIFNDWISQIIRLYNQSDVVEFEWMVGPIPIGDGAGKEVITKYTTNLASNGIFFTDSNGRQLVKREKDARDYPFWPYEKVAQNYYPVTSRILVSKDGNFPNNTGPAIVVLNDRSQGGTSMNNGEIELMIHRRLLFDDAFGVDEPLNETAYGTGLVARGKHWLLLCGEGTGLSVSQHREQAQEIFMDKIIAFADIKNTSVDNMNLLTPRSTIMVELAQILPPNIHVLTLEAVSTSQVLLRLEHFYEKGENPDNSKPAEISIMQLLQVLKFVKSIRETSLGGNQWIEKVKRFEWTPIEQLPQSTPTEEANVVADVISIRAMEIKTFLMDLIT